MTNAKKREALLALAHSWESGGIAPTKQVWECRYPPAVECGRALVAEVERLFPVKPHEDEEVQGPPVITLPVLGGGVYGLDQDGLERLAKQYDLTPAFLLKDLGLVAAKIQAGAMAKKTKRGMPRALFAWAEVAKRKWDRERETQPARQSAAPVANGKPRLFQMGSEEVVAYLGQTYRKAQWPEQYGPWPGREGA